MKKNNYFLKFLLFKDVLFALTDRDIYRSVNFGKTWGKINLNLDAGYLDLHIYKNTLLLRGYNDFYISSDNGITWNIFNFNIEFIKYLGEMKVFNNIIFFAHTGENPKKMYYYSEDNSFLVECDASALTSEKFNLIEFQNKFYISNDKYIYVSNDTCKSWEIINTPYPLHKTNFFVNNNDKLYSVVGNEIYVFDGNEWSKWYGKDNYGNPQQLKFIDNLLYATSYSSAGYSSFNERLFRSSDMGKSWEPAIIGLDSIREYKFIGDIIVAAYNDYDYLISTDKGSTWKELGIDNASFRDIRAYEKNIIVTNNLREIYLSTDNGESWTNINEQLPFQITKKHNIEMFDNKLLLEHNGSLYYSEDLGDSWNDISEDLPEIPRYPDMYIDDFLIIISFDNKIYISYDKGVTWNERSSNFPEKFHITRIKKFENKLFIVSQEDYAKTNIYFSQDIGLSWKKITEEYDDNLYITDFVIKDDQIIIGNSLFRQMYGKLGKIIYADFNIVSVDNSDEPNDFITVYPNPAEDYIEIAIPNNLRVNPEVSSGDIEIYDMLGEKVMSVEDTALRQAQQPRSRSVGVDNDRSFSGYFDTSTGSVHRYAQQPLRIDISHLPKGVYFVRFGERVEKVVKM